MNYLKKHNVQLGSDPELLATLNDINFPVIGKIGGTKSNPLYIDEGGYRGFQEDNVALEYTTQPTQDKKDFIAEQSSMYNLAVTKLVGVGLGLSNRICASYYEELLQSDQARTFGCEASTQIYTNDVVRPVPPDPTMRSVGGHIHISYDNHSEESNIELAKLLDLILTASVLHRLPKVVLNQERARRQTYGKAGEIRHKSYGFEYRTPSSAWVRSKDNIGLVWEAINHVFKLYSEGYRLRQNKYKSIQAYINDGEQFPATANPLNFLIKK